MDNNNNEERKSDRSKLNNDQSIDIRKQSQSSERYHHQAIITVINTQIDKDKNDFLKSLGLQFEKQEEIERLSTELKGDIKNLSNIVQKILHKHHTDYIMTFSAFMETIRKDLRKKIEQMDQIEEQKMKVNDINILKTERDFFRSYSVKLSSINKDLTCKIDDMKIKMEVLSDEVKSLTMKWKNLEKDNKQLILELEASILKNQGLKKDNVNLRYFKEKDRDRDRDKDNNSTPIFHQIPNRPIIKIGDSNLVNINKSKVYSYHHHHHQSIEIIEKLKNKLKREKFLNQRSTSEIYNLAQEKNKLESIFLDCVEETRKNVWNRRLKGRMTSKDSFINTTSFPLYSNGCQYQSFLPSNKREILESFLFNDEVWTVLRDALFGNKSIDHSSLNQSKQTRLNFKKINLRKFPNAKETRTTENKISFFNPKQSPLSKLNSKKEMFDFLKRAQSHNMLLPIKLNH